MTIILGLITQRRIPSRSEPSSSFPVHCLHEIFEYKLSVINHGAACNESVSALFSLSVNTSWPSTCVRPRVWLSRRMCLISRCPHCSAGLQPHDSQVCSAQQVDRGPSWMRADVLNGHFKMLLRGSEPGNATTVSALSYVSLKDPRCCFIYFFVWKSS